jgi:hypothetical protein
MLKALLLLLTAVTLGLWPFTATSAAKQPVLTSRASLMVVDADGVQVGRVLSVETSEVLDILVAFEFDHQPFVLRVFSHRLGGTESRLYFQSSNCSGVPLVAWHGSLVLPSAVVPPGNTLYLTEPGAIAERVVGGYVLDGNGGCGPTSDEVFALPARVIIDLDTLFTPPFSIR